MITRGSQTSLRRLSRTLQLSSASEADGFFDEDEEASEGRILTRRHMMRERARGLVEKKKGRVLAETGKLACEACGFDFRK